MDEECCKSVVVIKQLPHTSTCYNDDDDEYDFKCSGLSVMYINGRPHWKLCWPIVTEASAQVCNNTVIVYAWTQSHYFLFDRLQHHARSAGHDL